jgi:2'-hydroxyisoflavone reductase
VKLLVLGGTRFLGRHLVDAALAGGHEVTLFIRRRTNPELFPEAERREGDRDGNLSALEARSWDAVVDTCGYFPRIVRASAQLLAESVDHYTFISSISVYADLSRPVDESSPVATLEDETVEEFGPEFEYYGPLKALCERAVQEAFGNRTLIVRPGFIVGPYDPTDRFTYWPRRAAEGGMMIAPAPPDRPVQFIDARDLAMWILRMVEQRKSGVYNATNEGVPWRALAGDAEAVWVSDEFLTEHGVGEEELPLWSADPSFVAIHEAGVSAAIREGLTFRAAEQTLSDTLEWDAGRGDHEPAVGLSREREAELIATWNA